MRKLTILFLSMLGAIILPWLLGQQFSQIRRDVFLISFVLTSAITVIGVIWLWGSKEDAPETPTLIKMVLYAGALLLFQPLRPFALSFYPLALMLPVVLGLLMLLGRSSSTPVWLRIDTLQRWAFTGFAFLLANAIVLAATAFFAPAPVPSAAAPGEQVQAMAAMDQEDRMTGRILLAPERDDQRVARVEALASQGVLTTPAAWVAAALILQHGQCPQHFEMAYRLASRAYEAGDADAEWLMQAAYDRWQLSLGKPQKYGTQPDFRPGAGSCDESR